MGLVVTARELTTRVRQQVQDEGTISWSDTEILDAINQQFETITSEKRLNDQLWDLDYIDAPVSSLVEETAGLLVYDSLPLYALEVKQLEIGSGRSGWRIIPEIDLATTNTVAGELGIWAGWNFSGPGWPGKLQIQGTLRGGETIRIWYIRRYPDPIFSDGGSTWAHTNTSTNLANSTTVGEIEANEDAYIGMKLFFESDRKTVTITDSTALGVVSYAETTLTPNQPWSLVYPLEPEYSMCLVYRAAYNLATRAGQVPLMTALREQMMYHNDRFLESITMRSSASPRRLQNNRVGRYR